MHIAWDRGQVWFFKKLNGQPVAPAWFNAKSILFLLFCRATLVINQMPKCVSVCLGSLVYFFVYSNIFTPIPHFSFIMSLHSLDQAPLSCSWFSKSFLAFFVFYIYTFQNSLVKFHQNKTTAATKTFKLGILIEIKVYK